MGRHSRNMDKKLVDAAMRLIPRTGFSGLKVRTLAKSARVNLGMFHYHFRTKANFASRVLQQFYDHFFEKFSSRAGEGQSPFQQLTNVLVTIAQHGRDHREFLLVLVQDAVQGYAPTIRFAKQNIPRHMKIVIRLVRQCQTQGLIKQMPIPFIIPWLMGSIATPNCVVAILERSKAEKPFGVSMEEARDLLLSDEAIEKRVEMALKAVAV